MPRTAFLFPGQGAQHSAMLHELPAVGGDVLALAADVLGEDPLGLDPDGSTRGAQLALLIAGTAHHRAIHAAGVRADYLAGHSVGLWTAAVAADAIDFADALRLVDLRASAMADASPPHAGMIAVDGVAPDTVETLSAELRRAGQQVWASNVNSPSQATASGTFTALALLTDLLQAVGARQVTRLAVAVPAHCPLMRPAADRVRTSLRAIEVRRPRIPVAGNLTGQTIFTADRLRAELSDTITAGVRWNAAVRILAERGADQWIQIPPGHGLLHLEKLPGRSYALETMTAPELNRRLAQRTAAEAPPA